MEIFDIKTPDVIQIEDEKEKETIKYSDEPPLINPFQSTTINVTPSNISPVSTSEPEPIQQKSISEQLGDINNIETSEKTIEEKNISEELNKIVRIENDKEVIEETQEIEDKTKEFLNEYGEIDLPKLINKVREFTGDLGRASDLISMSEIDLPDTYQITIDIKK